MRRFVPVFGRAGERVHPRIGARVTVDPLETGIRRFALGART